MNKKDIIKKQINEKTMTLFGYVGSEDEKKDRHLLEKYTECYELNFKIESYILRSDHIFNHILAMIRTIPNYVSSEPCAENLALFFKYKAKVNEFCALLAMIEEYITNLQKNVDTTL